MLSITMERWENKSIRTNGNIPIHMMSTRMVKKEINLVLNRLFGGRFSDDKSRKRNGVKKVKQ